MSNEESSVSEQQHQNQQMQQNQMYQSPFLEQMMMILIYLTGKLYSLELAIYSSQLVVTVISLVAIYSLYKNQLQEQYQEHSNFQNQYPFIQHPVQQEASVKYNQGYPFAPQQQAARISNLQQEKANHSSIHDAYQKMHDKQQKLERQKKFDFKNDPYLKIQNIKNMSELDNDEHICTVDGVLKSKKNTNIEGIIMGRQPNIYKDGLTIYPNDIILPNNDRSISRIHCKIIYKDGFIAPKPLTEVELSILIGIFKKQNNNSQLIRLNTCIAQKIVQFLKPERKFYIVDLGSMFGTFIKLKKDKIYNLEKDTEYLIGQDCRICILHINKCSQHFYNFERELELLYDEMSYLYKKHKQNIQFHGLSEEQTSKIKSKNPRKNKKTNKNSKIPYLQLQISQASSPPNSNQYKFHNKVLKLEGKQIVTFIQILTQFLENKIQYNMTNQLINEEQVMEMDYCQALMVPEFHVQESSPCELSDVTEIKISESIQKLTIHNNTKEFQQKLRQENEIKKFNKNQIIELE